MRERKYGWMIPPPIADKSGQLAVLVAGGSERRKHICRRGPRDCRRHALPRFGESFHARHRAKTRVAGKHFIATQTRKSDFHSRRAGFFRDKVGVDAVDGGEIHRMNGGSDRGKQV